MRSRYIRTLAGIMAAALVIGGCGGTGNGGTSSDAAVQGQEGEADGSSENGGDAAGNEMTAVAEQTSEGDGEEADVSNGGAGGAAEVSASEPWEDNPLQMIDDNYRTYYEVFVYSFCDSDGDGIGDLQGLISKLDYINDGDDARSEELV